MTRTRLLRSALALVVVSGSATGLPALAMTPRVGAPEPPLAVKTLAGADLDLARLRGKVVVVNVWAHVVRAGPRCRCSTPFFASGATGVSSWWA